MTSSLRIHALFCAGVMIFFALALQVQVTLFASENYQGLRLALADLSLPLIGLFIGGSLLLRKSAFPAWQKPFGYLWIFLLTGVMTYGLLRYHYLHGEFHHWALVNKFAGWFVLMAYLGTGAWIASQHSDVLIRRFARPFVYTFLIISGINATIMIYAGYHRETADAWNEIVNIYQLEGLMGNRNAYAFLLAAITVFTTIFSYKNEAIIPRRMLYLYWLLCPAFFTLNGSRVLWLAAPFMLGFLGWLNRKIFMRRLVPLVLAGFLMLLVIYPSTLQRHAVNRIQAVFNMVEFFSIESDAEAEALEARMYAAGDDVRLKILGVAWGVWKEDPVFGAGLGGIMRAQVAEFGDMVSVLDNSMLWILTEMGLIGFAVFLSCFIAMLVALATLIKRADIPPDKKTLALFALALLLIFGFFSLFHEILYTRFLWFFLGLGLALPPRTRQNVSNP